MSFLIPPDLILNKINTPNISRIITEVTERDLYRVGEYEKVRSQAKRELEEMGEFKIRDLLFPE